MNDISSGSKPGTGQNYERAQGYRRIFQAKCAIAAILLLMLAYLFQAPSPLRLNTDSIVLLSIAASAADGHGFLLHGQVIHFPPGYPAMVVFLDRLGMASSQSFILLNCAFLVATLAASYLLYQKSFGFTVPMALGLCCLVMLSFVLVKHMTLPLSDFPFMGLFASSLLLFAQSRDDFGRLRWGRLFFAIILAALAISIRTAGLALIPVLAWVMGRQILANLKDTGKGRPVLLWGCLIGIVLVGITCAFLVSKTRYFQIMKAVYFQAGLARRLQNNLAVHTMEVGEIGVNLPSAKLPAVCKPVFAVVGVSLAALVIRGLWLQRRSFDVPEVGLLTYGAMIFIWPYQDARFWLPVIPLSLGFVALAASDATSRTSFKFLASAACGWFILAGLLALAYSTRISWAGKRFPDLYGDGSLTPSYRAAFFGQTNIAVNDTIILLRRYDATAKRALLQK